MSDKDKVASEAKSKKPIIMAGLGILIVIGVIALVMNAGNIAKTTVEKMASQTMGVQVTLAGLDIDIQTRTVTASGLKIANPDGYDAPHAMTVETISIAASELSREKMVFDDITVAGTDVFLEVMQSGTNLTALKNNLEKGKQEKSEETPVKVIIQSLQINEARLHPKTVLTGGDVQTVSMPNMRLTDIGARSNGVIASEAIAQVMGHVMQVAARTSAQSGFFQGMDEESLKELQSSLDLSSSLMDQFKGDAKALGDAVKGMFER